MTDHKPHHKPYTPAQMQTKEFDSAKVAGTERVGARFLLAICRIRPKRPSAR